MRRELLLPLLLLPATAHGQKASSSDVYEDPARGFRVARPGPGWAFLPAKTSGPTFTVRAHPHPRDGTVEVSIEVHSSRCLIVRSKPCQVQARRQLS